LVFIGGNKEKIAINGFAKSVVERKIGTPETVQDGNKCIRFRIHQRNVAKQNENQQMNKWKTFHLTPNMRLKSQRRNDD